MEAQRYPGDFHGILAGSAALNFEVQNGLYHAWQARSNTAADGKAILTADRLPLLHQAVLAACDALDGVRDGLIADPRACRFDPAVLACSPGSAAGDTCFSAEEVQAARKVYDGPRDTATGERLTIGGPQPGSELAWAGVFVPASRDQPIFSAQIALEALRTLVFETPPPENFRLEDLRFDRATFDALRPRHALFDATNPDLSAFADRGGKLILWHGWADPHLSPINAIAYHEAVQHQLGSRRAQAFERLYLFPGVHHCGEGEGPSAVDLLTPLMNWVESGQAPGAIVARRSTTQGRKNFGQPTATSGAPAAAGAVASPQVQPAARVVFPYPVSSRFAGGDSDAPAWWRPGPPLPGWQPPAWAGADFFRPYAARDR